MYHNLFLTAESLREDPFVPLKFPSGSVWQLRMALRCDSIKCQVFWNAMHLGPYIFKWITSLCAHSDTMMCYSKQSKGWKIIKIIKIVSQSLTPQYQLLRVRATHRVNCLLFVGRSLFVLQSCKCSFKLLFKYAWNHVHFLRKLYEVWHLKLKLLEHYTLNGLP